MKENRKLLTLFGTYSALLLLASVIGITVLISKNEKKAPSPPETVIQTELVYVFAQSPSDTSEKTEADTRVWIVKEYEEMIGIFDENGGLVYSLDVYVKTLPEADRKLLREGIRITSEKQLRALIEDYSN